MQEEGEEGESSKVLETIPKQLVHTHVKFFCVYVVEKKKNQIWAWLGLAKLSSNSAMILVKNLS